MSRAGRDPLRGYVVAAGRLVHYRRAGSGPPVVLLHDSPRSSVLHLPLLRTLSDAFTVYALDTPGYGLSDPLPDDPRPELDEFGDAHAIERDLAIVNAVLNLRHVAAPEGPPRRPRAVAAMVGSGRACVKRKALRRSREADAGRCRATQR